MAVAWQDKKFVNIVSTEGCQEIVQNTQYSKPKIIDKYNKYMAVDKFDQYNYIRWKEASSGEGLYFFIARAVIYFLFTAILRN